MFVKQVSIFLENKPGALRELTELLGKADVDLMALSIADTENFGIIRIIINSNQIDPALNLLRENGFTARVNNVICAEVPDRPLGLCELLTIIEDADLSVEYMYSFMRQSGSNAHMILRLSDKEKGVVVLREHNVLMRDQEDIDRL